MNQTIFKFGDYVKCRTRGDEWISGFRFLAHVPELDHPYIVKVGDPARARIDEPVRAHLECEHDPVGKVKIEAEQKEFARALQELGVKS